ncbi:MAG: DUF4351 domain-containing protein [Blastocatellia bacterium]
MLGGLQLLFNFFAVTGCDSKTETAHRNVPPDENWSSFGGTFLMCCLSSIHFQRIFFLRSIEAGARALIEKLTVKRLDQLAVALLDFSEPSDLEEWLKRDNGKRRSVKVKR